MKKRAALRTFSLIILILFSAAGFFLNHKKVFAQEIGSHTQNNRSQDTSQPYWLDATDQILSKGEKYHFLAQFSGKPDTVPTITSSNLSVASVTLFDKNDSSGILYEVNAVEEGEVVITTEYMGMQKSFKVKVLPAPKITLGLDTREYSCDVGTVYQFLVSEEPRERIPTAVSTAPDIVSVALKNPDDPRGFLYEIKALKEGEATIHVAVDEVTASFPVSVSKPGARLNVQTILQKPELPAGCEVVALNIVLNYYGYSIDKVQLNDRYLSMDKNFYYKNGKQYGPDPAKVFAGDTKSTYYGCYAQVITDTANKYLDSVHSDQKAKNVSSSSPAQLYQYLKQNKPVIVWATYKMEGPSFVGGWYSKDTGEWLPWIGGEHCMVLIGYDENTVTMADPLVGTTTYQRALFEKEYERMGKQAAILENESQAGE